ncbi:hypothetical protein [Conexibacter arvalis]|uniref:Uncharacterized protein n=1 Tax=Conexibacter arvalis TaxID=912552 RepID=A0A840IGY8_9ACTN|nr:hypothetical protein [Conexibacter arvalis]MBB4664162.1 hypothetical protein [Conexibacter arvalis]
MPFRDPEDWTDDEIARQRDLIAALYWRDDRRPYIPRVEWEQFSRWRRWHDRIIGRMPVEQPYDRAVRAQRARRAAERTSASATGG